jgi:hypothetical protein
MRASQAAVLGFIFVSLGGFPEAISMYLSSLRLSVSAFLNACARSVPNVRHLNSFILRATVGGFQK